MTTLDTPRDLESALRDLLEFEPRSGLVGTLDERVRRAIESPGTTSATPGGAIRSPRRRRMVALLAAAVALVGAGGALTLYQGMGPAGDVGFGLQLDRSVEVGATAIHDGYRVTIDRAYLDAERLMLGIRVTDELERPDVSQLMSMYAVVSDADGEWHGAGAATSHPIGQWAATNVVTMLPPITPLAEGARPLHVVIPHIFVRDATASPPVDEETDWNPWHQVDGPWTFDIELTVDGGAVVATPGTGNRFNGIEATLRRVVIGPSAIRVRVEVDDPGTSTWVLIGEVRRGDHVYPINLSTVSVDGVVDMQTDGGTDDATGDWALVISEAMRTSENGASEERIEGPWTFEFTVP